MVRRNTSVRFTDDEYELIDAMAAGLSRNNGTPMSRADVFRTLLKGAGPVSVTPEPELSRWRRAYDVVFNRLPRPDLPSEQAPKVDAAKRAAGEDAEARADKIALENCKHVDTRFNGTMRICNTCGKRVS
jgi:hypothetical protein